MVKAKNNKQMNFWGGEPGRAYVDRNPLNLQESDILYLRDYGITRRELNERFLGDLNHGLKILEVGANIGLQLELLRLMGFKNLLGIELNNYAVEKAYRDKQELFWKQDFLKLYTSRFPDLKIVKSEELPVLNSKNFSQMFLLEKN